MIALQQDRPGPVGTIEAGPSGPLAEEADVLPVFFSQLHLQRRWLARILLVESLERLAVGLTVSHILVQIDLLVIPQQREFLALERDVERLPLAGRLREVFGGKARS